MQWDQYPTYEDGIVSFKGALLNDAVFSHPDATPRRGADIYPNFRMRLATDRKYLGSVVPPGSALPLSGWPLYAFDVVADSYQLDGQSFDVSFTFPDGPGATPSEYVVTVYGFQDETRNPTIGTHSDSGAYTDLLGYARIRRLSPYIAPTATPTPTPAQIPVREDLYEYIQVPEHLSYVYWGWTPTSDVGELVFDFTIHNDPGDFSDDYGLYLIVNQGRISGNLYYFGLQTDVYDQDLGRRRGKGLVFSRWGNRDLDDARIERGSDTWLQESGHEGAFIGVRRAYEWDEGNYRMWIAPDEHEVDEAWHGVWFTDLDTGETVWVGSLKFPDEDGDINLHAEGYSTLEIYGLSSIRPIDIPEWYVSLDVPEGDGEPADRASLGYSVVWEQDVSNSDVQYLDGRVHLRIGGTTMQVGKAREIYLELP